MSGPITHYRLFMIIGALLVIGWQAWGVPFGVSGMACLLVGSILGALQQRCGETGVWMLIAVFIVMLALILVCALVGTMSDVFQGHRLFEGFWDSLDGMVALSVMFLGLFELGRAWLRKSAGG